MKKVTITKKGKKRTIYAPDESEKQMFRQELQTLYQKSIPMPHAHGFLPGKGIVTAAQKHIGFNATIAFDLADFFDTVTPSHVVGKLTKEQIEKLFIEGAPRQGLPTSPHIANLAAVEMDKAIVKWLDKRVGAGQYAYTRYADDLTISVIDVAMVELVLAEIPKIVSRSRFKVNHSKTEVYYAKGGRRMVLGVAVGPDDIRAPREIRRKIRAAVHQKRYHHAKGLREFAKLKEPGSKRKELDDEEILDFQDAAAIAKIHGLAKPSRTVKKVIQEDTEVIDGVTYIITNNPVYFYLISESADGWRSCMNPRKTEHKYFYGIPFWQHHPGVSIAAKLSDEEFTLPSGRKIKRMLARVIVMRLKIGEVEIDVYSSKINYAKTQDDLIDLAKWIGSQWGIMPLSQVPWVDRDEREWRSYVNGAAVVGSVPVSLKKPYFDDTRAAVRTINGEERYVVLANI